MYLEMHSEGILPHQIKDALSKVPFANEMKQALELVKNTANTHLVILSDANTFFIEEILKVHGLDQIPFKIISNPGVIDDQGRLCISRYMTCILEFIIVASHGCPLGTCGVNLCKFYSDIRYNYSSY